MKLMLIVSMLMGATLFSQTFEDKADRLATLARLEFDASGLDRQRDAELRALGGITKDEFETQAEFDKRKSEAAGKAQAIRSDYERRTAEAKKVFAARRSDLRAELGALLAQSLQDVNSSFVLGTYDPESNAFPVTLAVSGQTLTVKVPRELARDFKSQAANVSAKGKKQLTGDLKWEYFNWNIALPGGQSFAFGEQRGAAAQVAQLQSTPPPSLTARVSFSEPSGNNALDAEEKATLTLAVTNNGKGSALGLEARISVENTQGITSNTSLFVGEIPAGATRTGVLELSANDRTISGKAVYTFSFTEARGFPPDPIKVTFDTRALVPPRFILADVGVREPGGNGKIDNEEVVDITARIQNVGSGNARGVKVVFDLGENVTKMPESASSFVVGDLASGATYDATIKVYTNKVATEIPVYISITEPSGRYDVKRQRLTQLKLNQRVQGLQEVVIAGKESERRQITIAGGLSVDVDQNIPSGKAKNPDAVALVIGISKYKNPNVPTVDFAKHGAAVVKEYLINAMGFSEERVLYAEDENAGRNDFNILFQKLSNYVKAGKSDVFVYYNGHGAPDTKTSEAFFVPYDCDPEYASVSGYPVSEFYNQIGRLPARSVTVVLDACFSGSSPRGLLFKGVSPALLKVKNPVAALQNGVVFSSSSENQLSNWYPEKKHGLFTYFFLKGLQGLADANGDKQITAEELEQYLKSTIPDKAREQNREQTPQVAGNKQAVIVNYQNK
jgi:hypothetical protein